MRQIPEITGNVIPRTGRSDYEELYRRLQQDELQLAG